MNFPLEPSEQLLDELADTLTREGYLIADHLLPPLLVEKLAFEFHQVEPSQLVEAGIGRQADYQKNEKVRLDKIQWLDAKSPVSYDYLSWMEALRIGLNRRLFLGLFDFESHYASYQVGAFYKKHFDAFKAPPASSAPNRVLSTVLYLNHNWEAGDGGELVIYADDSETVLAQVAPTLGRLVIFLSERFPHEVLMAHRERLSIAGWFRTQGLLL